MIVDQDTFRAALLNPDADRPLGLSDGQGQAAGRRFDVYRNNVAVSLTEALETAFPVVAKLVGSKNFGVLAGAFLRRYPPSSPMMMFYGAEMPDFLGSFEPTRGIGYLPDVARLELALRQSYHAVDATPMDPSLLQSIAPEDLMASRVSLAPSLKLVRSSWPVFSIWRFNMEDDAPKPQMAAEDVLVVRPDLDPGSHLLASGGGAFLEALFAKKTFGEALESATADAPDFDLSTTLALLIGAGALLKIGD